MDCVRHIRVRLRTAYINNFIPFRWKANQVPFTVCYKLLCVALIWFHFNVKSVTIVRPWTELHRAELKRNQNWDQVNDNRESLQAKRDRGQSGLRIQEPAVFQRRSWNFLSWRRRRGNRKVSQHSRNWALTHSSVYPLFYSGYSLFYTNCVNHILSFEKT